jgi:hypothetical protein
MLPPIPLPPSCITYRSGTSFYEAYEDKCLDLPLKPRLFPFELGNLHSQDNILLLLRGHLEVDIQIRRHHASVRYCSRTTPHEALIQHRRQQSAMYVTWIATKPGAYVADLDVRLAAGFGPCEWSSFDLSRPYEGSGDEVLHLRFRDLRIWTGLREFCLRTKLFDKWMVVNEVFMRTGVESRRQWGRNAGESSIASVGYHH